MEWHEFNLVAKRKWHIDIDGQRATTEVAEVENRKANKQLNVLTRHSTAQHNANECRNKRAREETLSIKYKVDRMKGNE